MEYRLDSTVNMISLAKEVQSSIYWGMKFEYEGETYRYSQFWDVVESVLDEGYVGVIISNNNEVSFFKERA